jgi:peroxiredoxin Q/BCP
MILLALASTTGASQALAQESHAPLVAGSRAPDCTFTRSDGSAIALSEYHGKKVVVLLFMRGFTGEFACLFCDGQTRDYKRAYDQLKASEAEVLMVLPGATDPRGYLKAIGMNDSEKPDPGFSVPFPVLLDTEFKACKAFDVAFNKTAAVGEFPVKEPATFVIGKDGHILFAYHGKSPGDRPAVDAVLERVRGKVPVEPPSTATAHSTPPPEHRASLDWMDYDQGLQLAKARRTPVLLEFYADW